MALRKIWIQGSFHKYIEFDRPGERSPEIGLLLLTVTGVSTTSAIIASTEVIQNTLTRKMTTAGS